MSLNAKPLVQHNACYQHISPAARPVAHIPNPQPNAVLSTSFFAVAQAPDAVPLLSVVGVATASWSKVQPPTPNAPSVTVPLVKSPLAPPRTCLTFEMPDGRAAMVVESDELAMLARSSKEVVFWVQRVAEREEDDGGLVRVESVERVKGLIVESTAPRVAVASRISAVVGACHEMIPES